MTRRSDDPRPNDSRGRPSVDASPDGWLPLQIGRYPTPIERLDSLCGTAAPASAAGASVATATRGARGRAWAASELWVKRDDRTHEVYGGNKVRKLEWLLADARALGYRRIVTMGAAGSHHVLATTYFGRREGFEVEAVLVAQPRSEHALDVLRAAIGLGLRAIPAGTRAAALVMAASRSGRHARFISVGGSSVIGSMGYVMAARELAAQIRSGEMPEPDVCVVALGSGGTAAGLAAGFAAERLKTKVVGVCVADPVWVVRAVASWLESRLRSRAAHTGRWAAARGARETGGSEARRDAPHGDTLRLDARFLGRGYGHRTVDGDEATRAAASVGLDLDPTYTAKAFASALWHVRARQCRVVLYWHTLSSAPMAPLLVGAPEARDPPQGAVRPGSQADPAHGSSEVHARGGVLDARLLRLLVPERRRA